jgi:D-inositol-3-phosphate glycosyltransferase
MPLRLAFVSLHTSPADLPGAGDAGGMNVVERAQAEALAARGHTVEMITRRSNPDAPEVMTLAPGVTLRHLAAGPPRPLAKSLIDAHIPEFAAGLAGLGPFDLIHSHHWMSGVAALPSAREWGVPHIQSFHSVAALPGSNLSSGEPPESSGRVPGEALVAQRSDAIVAISAAEARTVVERCGADPDRVSIVRPGVNHDDFRPLRPDELPWRPDGIAPEDWPRGYLLFAARLQPLKGPDLAIRALGCLDPRLRPHLVIAGDASADFASYTDELRELVRRRGLDNDVTFLGPTPRARLAVLMRGAELMLVPSYSETFGLVALEANSSGVPVVASAAGGLREAIVHGETGQLMDSREPTDWARALTLLVTDDALRLRQGAVARIHARQFQWPETANTLEGIYQRTIGENS